MSRLSKIIRANPRRKTRFHAQTGTFMGRRGFYDLPKASAHYLQRRLMGRYPALPWWPYPAIEAVDALISPQVRVLEYGSGMSTIWLANRAAHVISIESNSSWHAFVQSQLSRQKMRNVNLVLRNGEVDFGEDDIRDVNLAIVDGPKRAACMDRLVKNMRPGSAIYLDNSDVNPEAAQKLANASAEISKFCGFAPGLAHVTEGVLGKLAP